MSFNKFGIALMILGVAIFIFGKMYSRKSVIAQNGSVAVGGNNFGNINNFNLHAKAEKGSHSSHAVAAIAIVVELAGIGVTIWHAMHMAGK